MSRFGRLPPPKPRQPAEYRHTAIDVFIGGPADGEQRAAPEDMDAVCFAAPTRLRMTEFQDFTNDYERETFTKVRYRRERLRSQTGPTIADVSFWIIDGMSIEQAMVKLCLGYHPAPVEEHTETI